MQWARKHKEQQGFTIVELLIVVVVIAILATITIVAYNGITERARVSVAQNEVSQVTKKLITQAVHSGDLYPSTLQTVGINDTDTITYAYQVNNSSTPAGFCVGVSVGEINYYAAKTYSYGSGPTVLDKPMPTEGTCPEPSAPIITNYAPNPSAETSVSDYSSPNSSTRAISTVRAYSGASSVYVTMPSGNIIGNVGVRVFTAPSFVAAGLKPNTTYTVTVYTYVPSGQASVQLSLSGSGRASTVNPVSRFNNQKDTWVRIQNSFTTTAADGVIQVYIMNNETTFGSGNHFWADAVMLTEGTDVPAYADGTTAGWSWTGTPHASTSAGPTQ